MTLVQQQGKIEIPYGSGDEVLELEIANLPEPDETILILQQQQSKINLWIQIATEYYRQGKHDAFEMILGSCLDYWTQERVKLNLPSYPDGDKDRIRALDLIAIFYVRKGCATKNREKRREYFARAAQKFTEVDKSEFINISKHGSEYQFHLLGRAYCCLIEGRNDQAEAQFNFVHQQQSQSGRSESVPALLGKACIEFNKRDANGKKHALNYYKKALQICPNAPADVRLGLAICFYKLNMMEKAEEAFSKALALNPRCVGALIGLAVLELNKKTNVSIKRGIDYISRAYRIDQNDPMVLTLLADHFFYSSQHDKVIKLSTKAMENTENEAMQAHACYQSGRAYHKRKEYDLAFEYYYKATTFGGTQFYIAHYGLGQMYIHRKEYDSAIQSFETVLKKNPDNHETLKVLASLYARCSSKDGEHKGASNHEKARQYLKKVTESRPKDVEAWVELASLTEQYDTQTALSAYRTSIKLYEEKSTPVPPEIYNNIAALLFSIDALDESEKFYNLALSRCEEERPNNELHHGSIIYTIRYNLGRLFEAKNQLVQAAKTYKDIMIQHPLYLDCYLRLGCMERDKGFLFEASDKFKEIFRIEPNNATAWTLMANMHLSKLELTPCQKKFELVLGPKSNPRPDLYSLISIGNVWLLSQYQPLKDVEKLNLQRKRALEFYVAALKHDRKNMYAANGIGCILAVKGHFNEAREIFSQVREATADFPDVWINLAHIYVEQKQYAAAVQMYENCHKKFFNNSNIEILSYMARALYKANKFADCKRVLLKARHLCPHNLVVLFNLAKVLKTLAREVFQDRKSTYHAVVNAEYELRLAESYFRYYAAVKEKKIDVERNSVDIGLIQHEAQSCKDLLVQVENSVKIDAEQRDREESLRRMEHEEQLAKEMARKAEEEERRLNEERQKREELESKRKELLKKQEETKQKLLQEDSGALIIDDGSDDNIEPRGKKRKKPAKEGKKRRERERDDDREKSRSEKPAESRKYKSRAILSSDSSSSDDDGPITTAPAPMDPADADSD